MTGLLTGRFLARRAGFVVAAAALSLPFVAATPAATQDALPLSDTHRQWLEEEVIYIISDREKDAFGQLQSEAERDAFIEAFWRRRDPEPLTPENEFRTAHYERIAYANSRLGGETAIPGWMTDRGRLWIKLGEPDERETFAAVPGLYPAELWFYLQRNDRLLPPLYILFFRDNMAGSYRQFNHVLDDPEDLLPAQALDINDSRRAAFEFLQEMSPQLAHATITMRADRGPATGLMQPDQASLDAAALLSDIERAPYRLLDTNWVSSAAAGRGLVETDYLFNLIPSAGVARVLPGPPSSPASWYVHYALEIEPQNFTVAREEDGNEYFTRFDIQGEISDSEGVVIYDFASTPFLRLTERQLEDVGARPFAFRGMFPLIEGAWEFRLIFKNAARTEYTVFEDSLFVPDGTQPDWIGRPLIAHGQGSNEGDYATWAPTGSRIIPNARAIGTLGSAIGITVPAATAEVSVEVFAWDADRPVPNSGIVPLFETTASPDNGLALVELATNGWATGHYTVLAAHGDTTRATRFSLGAGGSVTIPWGLTDSFDANSPGAASATLAEQWLRLERLDRARPLFDHALTADPNHLRSRTVLARIALDEDRPREAVRLLEPALAQNPRSAAILRTLGDAHRLSGRPARAVELYERAIEVEAPDAPLLNALGFALARLGEHGRAIETLERSLALNAEQAEINDLLVRLRRSFPSPGE